MLRAVFDAFADGKCLGISASDASGVVGRILLHGLQELVQRWLESRTVEQLFRARLAILPRWRFREDRSSKAGNARAKRLRYLLGRPHQEEALPEIVKQSRLSNPEARGGSGRGLPCCRRWFSHGEWRRIAKKAPWQRTRMNLKTFARLGVFDNEVMVKVDR